MNVSFLTGGITSRLTLRSAILLYVGGTEGEALATVHEIEAGNLLPGTPIDRNLLSDITARLAGQAEAGRAILPADVLYSDASLLVWWCKSERRPIYFKSGKADLDDISGTSVPHPPLLFLARNQQLSVWALGADERPSSSTRVFVAPYFNIYESGAMCTGNVRMPESLAPTDANLAQWEETFFSTNFTHSNIRGKLTAFEGGHNALWQSLASSPKIPFPMDSLVPVPKVTVGEILTKGGKL